MWKTNFKIIYFKIIETGNYYTIRYLIQNDHYGCSTHKVSDYVLFGFRQVSVILGKRFGIWHRTFYSNHEKRVFLFWFLVYHIWRRKSIWHLVEWNKVIRYPGWRIRKLKESVHMLDFYNLLSRSGFEMNIIWVSLIKTERTLKQCTIWIQAWGFKPLKILLFCNGLIGKLSGEIYLLLNSCVFKHLFGYFEGVICFYSMEEGTVHRNINRNFLTTLLFQDLGFIFLIICKLSFIMGKDCGVI